MARGKHATSAEARRAREAAESEVVTLRRKVEHLNTENDFLHKALSEAKDEFVTVICQLNAQIAEGTSGEVSALRAELKAERERSEQEWAAAVERVGKLLGRSKFSAEPSFYAKLAAALRVNVGDIFGAGNPEASRSVRRMTNKRANLNAQLKSDTELIGH